MPVHTPAEAAYDLLLMLAAVDGKIDDTERLVMQYYVEQNFGANIDYAAEEKALLNVPPDNLMQRFQDAATLFYEQGTAEDRISLMLTAMELVMADGVMTDEESSIFKGLADVWGLKYETLLEDVKARRTSAA